MGFLALALVAMAATLFRSFPRGLVAVAILGLAALSAWEGVRRRGAARTLLLALAAVLLVVSLVVVAFSGLIAEGVVAVAALLVAVIAQKQAFALRVRLPAAPRPSHPVVVWNPRSGGGKATRANLPDEARARGIEPIELGPGDDLVELVEAAVARGADALAAAGGDGTQALVAEIAAKHDLPFACIPAGTRNHFALDLGVDREDVVGALDAMVSGGERRVDLAEVNGRTFVNNVSLGLYAQAVQRKGYRDAKLRTILDTVPDLLGPGPTDTNGQLRWSGPDGEPHDAAVVILVSNNTYRLGRLIGSGTRPRIDEGMLGVAVLSPGGHGSAQARPAVAAVVHPGLRGRFHGSRPGRSGRGGDAARPAAALPHPSARAARAARAAAPRGFTVRRPAGDAARRRSDDGQDRSGQGHRRMLPVGSPPSPEPDAGRTQAASRGYVLARDRGGRAPGDVSTERAPGPATATSTARSP